MAIGKIQNTNKHKEAFCLMQYKCESCGEIESIWNSRDGVTPFCVHSSCCENSLSQHANWQLDMLCTELPAKASRVFVNCTKERAETKAHAFWDAVGEQMLEAHEHLREIGKEKLTQGKIEEIYGEGNQPDLICVSDYIESLPDRMGTYIQIKDLKVEHKCSVCGCKEYTKSGNRTDGKWVFVCKNEHRWAWGSVQKPFPWRDGDFWNPKNRFK